ncbi:MAG: flavin reductase family protein [Rhizobacter sp.]
MRPCGCLLWPTPSSPSSWRGLGGFIHPDGAVDAHGVIPRPIAWISTISKLGIPNLAPYSFFTVASCNPPVLMYTQVNPRDGTDKDTLVNILETKSCVVNVVSASLLEKMNATCANLPREISEFSAAGIESCESHFVAAPGVALSKVRYECSLRQVIQVSSEPSGGSVVLLNVLGLYIASELLVDSRISHHLLDAVGKLGGDWYACTRETVALPRP